jgi:hypothetical protein
MSAPTPAPNPQTPAEFREWLQQQLSRLPDASANDGFEIWTAAYNHAARLGAGDLLRTIKLPSRIRCDNGVNIYIGYQYMVVRGAWDHEVAVRLSKLIRWTRAARPSRDRSVGQPSPGQNEVSVEKATLRRQVQHDAEQPKLSSLNMAAAEPPAEPPPANGAPERDIEGEPDAAPLPHQAVAQTPRLETPLETPPRPAMKEPSKAAMIVYRYRFGSDLLLSERKTQTEVANDPVLMKQLGKKVDQATISRYLKQVRKWIEAGNLMPETSQAQNSQPKSMDPERLDLGKRQDGRTERQRGRRDNDD